MIKPCPRCGNKCKVQQISIKLFCIVCEKELRKHCTYRTPPLSTEELAIEFHNTQPYIDNLLERIAELENNKGD